MKSKPYIFSADIIRIVAAFFVVSIHVTDPLVNGQTYIGGISWWWATLVFNLAHVAVPLFVMLSGFFFLDQERKFKTDAFLKKHLPKILVPLVFWGIFYFWWQTYFWKKTFTAVQVLSIIFSVSFFHLYYLILIAGLYLMTPYLRKKLPQLSQNRIISFISASFLLGIFITFINYRFPATGFLRNALTISFLFLNYYIAGDYLRNVALKKSQLIFASVTFCVLLVANTFLTYLNMKFTFFPSVGGGQYFCEYLSPLIVPMSLLAFVLLRQTETVFRIGTPLFVQKPLKYFSLTTFGIYLIHPLVIDLTDHYLHLGIHEMTGALWLWISLKVMVIFIFSLLATAVYMFIRNIFSQKKSPLQKGVLQTSL